MISVYGRYQKRSEDPQRMYNYPPDTDEWTKKILQEAQFTFSQMSGTEIATMITMEDFQNYWQQVDEKTSSSFSGITCISQHAKGKASL
jgi:hypothetical protein